MRIQRNDLILHLQRALCFGQCTEAVFRDGFAADILTVDQQLLVVAPSVRGAEALPAPIGVTDLSLLVKALKLLPGEGNAGVVAEVRIEHDRLIVDDAERGIQRLVLAAPGTIATRVERTTVEALVAQASGTEVPLLRSAIVGMCDAYGLYKADEVAITVGPRGGKFVVGGSNSHAVEIPVPNAIAETEYTLRFGKHLVAVLSSVTDFSTAKLHLGGPGKPIRVDDGGFTYILAARVESPASGGKPAVKDAAGAAAPADGSAPPSA